MCACLFHSVLVSISYRSYQLVNIKTFPSILAILMESPAESSSSSYSAQITSSGDQPLALPYQHLNNDKNINMDDQKDRYEACFKMDSLGPMIINTDGTIQRVSNWHELTPEEQAKTFRLICARNKKRIEALKQKEEEEQLGEKEEIEN